MATGQITPLPAPVRPMPLNNTLNRLQRHIAGALAVAFTTCPGIPAYAADSPTPAVTAPMSSAPAENAGASLRKVLDAEWEWRMAQFPERASDDGDHRYDDRLT